MKVIKPGREQKCWAKRFTCTGKGNGGGGCGARLLVEQTDLYETHTSAMGEIGDRFTTFQCPQCKVQTDVKVGVPPLGKRPT
jgi:hypothetical protein